MLEGWETIQRFGRRGRIRNCIFFLEDAVLRCDVCGALSEAAELQVRGEPRGEVEHGLGGWCIIRDEKNGGIGCDGGDGKVVGSKDGSEIGRCGIRYEGCTIIMH